MSHYEVLNVDQDATHENIKRSYQDLVLKNHPDRRNSSSILYNNKFQIIQEAWEVLRDTRNRLEYDQKLLQDVQRNRIRAFVHEEYHISDLGYDPDFDTFVIDCRCGGGYCLERLAVIYPLVLLECDTCSLNIQVNTHL